MRIKTKVRASGVIVRNHASRKAPKLQVRTGIRAGSSDRDTLGSGQRVLDGQREDVKSR